MPITSLPLFGKKRSLKINMIGVIKSDKKIPQHFHIHCYKFPHFMILIERVTDSSNPVTYFLSNQTGWIISKLNQNRGFCARDKCKKRCLELNISVAVSI